MRLLVVDGNSIVNRAFYGIRPLTTKDGQFTHAIYGFLTMLEKIKADTKPDRVAIAFDLKSPTFRHKAYAGYKAQRKGMPDELAQQLPPLKELLKLLGYTLVTCEGYEADDILGTLSKVCEDKGEECFLATGDRDSLQLVSDLTTVDLASNKQNIIYTPEKVMEDYGVTPKELIEVKAIQGDTSDNIPGVAGIGPKGATDLISKYHSVSYIYENIDALDIKDGVRKKLIDSKENAELSRMLGEICREAPIDTNLDSYKVTMENPEEAIRYMARFELFSLIEKMGLRDASASEPIVAEEEKKNIFKFAEIDNENINKLNSLKELYFSFAYNDKTVKMVVTDKDKVYVTENEDYIKTLLENSDIEKYTDNSKAVYSYAGKNGFSADNVKGDIILAAYLLNPSASSYDLQRLCEEYNLSLPECENENGTDYACNALLQELFEKVNNQIIANNQEKLLSEVEIPLAEVLAYMENTGVEADSQGIEQFGEMLGVQIENLQRDIYDSVGEEFNINSPKQLGVALFEKLGLPCKKKTKSGYSTNAEVLEGLYNSHPVVPMVLQYRTLAKLKSTYCDGLLKVIGEDGRIHSNFNQTETRTGRISSTEPNLQNIPVRTELGREMRKFFKAKEGYVFVDADYSQIELRVLAHISGDKNMIEAFKENKDIHTITASQVFNMPFEMVTPLMRSRAKAVNFGIVYGIGAYSLAKDIGVTNKEAKNYIDSYLAHYSGVDEYMKNVVEKAKKDGYVETMYGRRRYLPELSAGNHMTRAFGERVARNMPIQGTAADIIKIAMVKVFDRLKKENLHSRLILQIHDELIVEAPQDEAMRVAMLLQEEMENAVKLNVPLVADAAIGKTWYEAKG
ncbi:MAG: DNA polymerase I [Ruminococcus sp.]|nr:DNA polymerase I [Ruminococcus sp.]